MQNTLIHSSFSIFFSDRMDPFIAMSDGEFIARFQLQKDTMLNLIEEIRDQIPVATDRRGTYRYSTVYELYQFMKVVVWYIKTFGLGVL